ncbi:MAG TPA: hypothetical protein PK033_15675, partial [Acetivibrio sp.]|nr:hypothetical protein [Acetivibrio sp.]
QIMGHYTGTVSKDIRELLKEQFEEGYQDTEDELEELDYEPPPPVTEDSFFGVNKDRVDKLTEEIIAKESNIEKAALRYMDDVYRRTLYKAEVAMSAGATTLPQAIDMATRDFLNAGINCIEYKDGRRVNIADYVQMALRTAATRSYLNGAAAKRAELGIDTVLVSQYGACSETCLPWQGRVYIDDVWGVFEGERSGEMGKSKNGNWYPLLSVAIKGGLYHPNCRHSHTTWIEGVSKLPTALDPKKTGENYKLEQQQRKLERELRRFKRLQAGSLSEEDRRLYGEQIKKKKKELKEFVEKHKDILRRDYWRENVYGMPSMQSDVPNIKQFERYKERLGDVAPQAIEEFNRIKFSKGKEWIELQERYRYTGIVNRILAKYPEAVVFEEPEDIPVEYHKAAENLTEEQKRALYHYSHYKEGVRMNKYLGGVQGIELDEKEMQNLINTEIALNNMTLPYTTCSMEGVGRKTIKRY